MKKPRKLDPLEEFMINSYQRMRDAVTYCALCGNEIIWLSDQSLEEHAQEIALSVHHKCAIERYNRGH